MSSVFGLRHHPGGQLEDGLEEASSLKTLTGSQGRNWQIRGRQKCPGGWQGVGAEMIPRKSGCADWWMKERAGSGMGAGEKQACGGEISGFFLRHAKYRSPKASRL